MWGTPLQQHRGADRHRPTRGTGDSSKAHPLPCPGQAHTQHSSPCWPGGPSSPATVIGAQLSMLPGPARGPRSHTRHSSGHRPRPGQCSIAGPWPQLQALPQCPGANSQGWAHPQATAFHSAQVCVRGLHFRGLPPGGCLLILSLSKSLTPAGGLGTAHHTETATGPSVLVTRGPIQAEGLSPESAAPRCQPQTTLRRTVPGARVHPDGEVPAFKPPGGRDPQHCHTPHVRTRKGPKVCGLHVDRAVTLAPDVRVFHFPIVPQITCKFLLPPCLLFTDVPGPWQAGECNPTPSQDRQPQALGAVTSAGPLGGVLQTHPHSCPHHGVYS